MSVIKKKFETQRTQSKNNNNFVYAASFVFQKILVYPRLFASLRG